MEDNAGARAGHGRARLVAEQRRIGQRMNRGHVGGQDTRQRAGMTTRAGPELSPGRTRIAQIKVNVGSCHGQGGGHSRPGKGQSGRQHKAIGVAGITAGHGNGVADDMMEGRAGSGRRVRQRAKEGGW